MLMTKLKCIGGARYLRIIWVVSTFVAVFSLGSGAVLADDRSLDDSAKKVGNNFGEMLKGMGQELKKAGGTLAGSGKKDDKKEKKLPENETGKSEDKNSPR